jgi:hypothetical protein
MPFLLPVLVLVLLWRFGFGFGPLVLAASLDGGVMVRVRM